MMTGVFFIKASVKDKEMVEMLLFLVQNVDVFAWSPYKVPRVDPGFIVHKLNVDPLWVSKKQKPRRSAKEHVDAVRQEVKKLKEAGAIKEIFSFRVAGEYRGGKKEEWQMEGFY